MSVQQFDHRGEKRLITGTSGTGKTTLFWAQLRAEKARLKFVFDHQGEFSSRFKVAPVFDIEGLCEKTSLGGYVCFDPARMIAGGSFRDESGRLSPNQMAFAFFCDYVFEVSQTLKGRKILACDELQKLVSNRDEPQELLVILDTGRRYQLDCFFISQAPNRIHNAVRNQLTVIYTFRQMDANAVKYLADNGFDENEIRNLQNGCYLWRNLDSGENGKGGKAF